MTQPVDPKYVTFIKDTGERCWRCGRTAYQRPKWWNAYWMIERAHIDGCNHPRREDIRCVVSLCSLCHKIQHGERFMYAGALVESDAKPLSQEEVLGIKKFCDPKNWDRKFLQKHSIRRLPKAASYKRVLEISAEARRLEKERTK